MARLRRKKKGMLLHDEDKGSNKGLADEEVFFHNARTAKACAQGVIQGCEKGEAAAKLACAAGG